MCFPILIFLQSTSAVLLFQQNRTERKRQTVPQFSMKSGLPSKHNTSSRIKVSSKPSHAVGWSRMARCSHCSARMASVTRSVHALQTTPGFWKLTGWKAQQQSKCESSWNFATTTGLPLQRALRPNNQETRNPESKQDGRRR